MPKKTTTPARRVNNSSSNVRKKTLKSKQNMFNFINNIPSMEDEELDNLVLTFHNYDGTVRNVPCNKAFFYNERGTRRLKSNQIFQNINSLKHDFHAKYFVLS